MQPCICRPVIVLLRALPNPSIHQQNAVPRTDTSSSGSSTRALDWKARVQLGGYICTGASSSIPQGTGRYPVAVAVFVNPRRERAEDACGSPGVGAEKLFRSSS
jgi:hypothetical protein